MKNPPPQEKETREKKRKTRVHKKCVNRHASSHS